MKYFFFLIFITFVVPSQLMAQDECENYLELKERFEEGHDYQVSVFERPSKLTVLAIHGGWIEFGTSEIAQALAGEDHSLYLFEGIMPEGNWQLHITSSQFDEETAISLVEASEYVVSIHGFDERERHQVCLGGSSENWIEIAFQRLRRSGLIDQDVANPCGKFYARGNSNIVNRGAQDGLQIEISRSLREELLASSDKMSAFVGAVLGTILDLSPTLKLQ